MRSEEAVKGEALAVAAKKETAAVEEVVVSLCSRSICFYSSSKVQQETTSQAAAAAAQAEDDGARPPSVPRSRWLFPEEELPVLQWRRPRRCGVGLGNPHALCFMNAVLQALAYTPGVADDLLEGRHSSKCPLAAAAAAARRRARMLQQRHSSSDMSSSASAGNDAAVAGSSAAEESGAGGHGGLGMHVREKVVARMAREGRTRRRNSGSGVKGGSGGGQQEAEDDASVSFCLLCKLEEQVQSIHCASPFRGGASPAQQQQQQHDPTAEGVARGFVRNRFSRYVKQFVWRRYREGRQEDAHEFLRYLLDALMRCNSSTSSSTKRAGSSNVDALRMPPEVWLTSYFGQLFGGWLQSSVCCSSCGYCSRRFDACLDLPLDLTPAPASPAAACPWLSRAVAAGGEAAAGTTPGKRRCNSSSINGAEEGGRPAAKLVKRKVFAGSAAAANADAAAPAEGQCSSACNYTTERQGKAQEGRTASALAPALRRLACGRHASSRACERKRRHRALREGGSTVEKALQHFIAKEYLTGDNSYSCPQCKQKRPATKQLRVYTPPRVLVLFIKRFAVGGCWGMPTRGSSLFAAPSFLLKNQAPVAFPAVLNLAPYMVHPPPRGGATNESSSTTGQTSCCADPCASAAGSLKNEEKPSIHVPATRCQQQKQQAASSLRLVKLAAAAEERSNNSAIRKEDEASPRSNASTNSISTRASSSPSPSPSRSPPTGRTQTSVTFSVAQSNSETAAADASAHPSAMHAVSVPPVTAARSAAGSVGGVALPGVSGSSEAACSSAAAPPLYQLYAVVTHSGSSLSSGHYRCFVRAPASAPVAASTVAEEAAAAAASMWLLIDDEVVQTVSETFVLQRLQHDAYLLFYSRLPTVQQQEELLLRKAKQEEECAGSALDAAEQQRPQQQQQELGGVSRRVERTPTARWKLTPSGESLSNSESSSDENCSSASDSDYIDRDTSDSNSSSSSTWDLDSDRSDECSSSSSSSTCSSTRRNSSNRTDDEDVLERYKPRISALRRHPFHLNAARAHLRATRKSTSSPLQTEGSKTFFLYGKRFRLERLVTLQLSLRRRQRKQRVDVATLCEDRELQGSKALPQVEQLQQPADKTDGECREKIMQKHGKQRKQQSESPEQQCLGNKLNNSIARNIRLLSAEEMRGRLKAASNFTTQYGVAQPGTWSDGDEQNEATCEKGDYTNQRQPWRQLAFEHLQELQQPPREVRSRHDREYDRGKVKKVRKKVLPEDSSVGETVVVKSGDGDRSTLIVHQRVAFDSVLEQLKQGPKSGVRVPAKGQQSHRKQAKVHAKQKWQGMLKCGRHRNGK